MAWLGHHSQRPVAHCRFHRRYEFDPSEKWRLKDTQLTLLLSLARKQSHLPFSSIAAMQTSNSKTSPFPRKVHLRGWQRSSLIPAKCCKNRTLLLRIQWECKKKNDILRHLSSFLSPLVRNQFPSLCFMSNLSFCHLLTFLWSLWH